jgi:hypothetical protein
MEKSSLNLIQKIFFISLVLLLSNKANLVFSLPDKTPTGNPKVELIFFSCTKVNDAVQLTWRTASEINNEFFIPEKSADSTNFSEIGYVKGAGKSLMVNDYSYQDPNYENKVIYYRLKFHAANGKYSYSGIIALNINGAVKCDPKLQDHPDD